MLKNNLSCISGKMFKLLFVVLFVVVLSTMIYSETLFRVSGKVLRKGKGVKGVLVKCNGFDEKGRYVRLTVFTDKDGKYEFELRKGKYKIRVRTKHDKYMNRMYDLRYLTIKVSEKNIKNLNFYLFTFEDIVKVNKDILDSVPKNKPFVEYKWGRIPLHTEKECRKFVRNRLKEDKKMLSRYSGINIREFNGLKIRKPIPLYDLRGNIVSYIYYIVKNGIEIGRYEVMAIGKEVSDTVRSDVLVNKKIYEQLLKEKKTYNDLEASINRSLNRYCKIMKLKREDIEYLKLISGVLSYRLNGMIYSPYIMVKNKKNNKRELVSLKYGEGFPDFWTFEDIRNWYEKQMILGYLEQTGPFFVKKFGKLLELYNESK